MKLDVLYELDAPKPRSVDRLIEQTAFGVERAKSRDDWAEAIKIVCGRWREEHFEYSSDRFSFPRRMVTPKPWQDPHPPRWMAATSNGSAEVAAYRKASENPTPLTEVVTNKVAACTLVHVPDDRHPVDRQVWDSVAWWDSNLAQFTSEWELPHLSRSTTPTSGLTNSSATCNGASSTITTSSGRSRCWAWDWHFRIVLRHAQLTTPVELGPFGVRTNAFAPGAQRGERRRRHEIPLPDGRAVDAAS